MKKRLFALICVLIMVLSVLCACGSEKVPQEEETQGNAQNAVPEATDTPALEEPEQDVPGVMPDTDGKMVIDSLKWIYTADKSVSVASSGGYYYRDYDSDLYGIISLDGTYDSGAQYYNVSPEGAYFAVTLSEPSEPDNLDTINNTGIVDGYGNVIIPAEYAIVDQCDNERFYHVIKVTERTYDKEECLVYLTSRMFALSASDEDILYKGVWYVFDTETGKVVDGVSASNAYGPDVVGDQITYKNDDGDYVRVNTNGQPIPDDMQYFENGGYYDTERSTVYDAFGNKLFAFSKDQYDGISMTYDYYRLVSYKNGENDYVCLNKKGEVITPVFHEAIYIYGENLMIVGETAYDFAGNKLVEGPITTVREYDDFWYLNNYETDDFYVLDKNLKLCYAGNENDGVEFEGHYGCLKKTEGDQELYYSFVEEAFVYEGRPMGYGYIEVEDENGIGTLTNTLTGETVMSGFDQYRIEKGEDGKLYFFAAYYGEYTVWSAYVME